MNAKTKYVLVEKHQSSGLMQVVDKISHTSFKADRLLNPIKKFLGMKTVVYKRSRIVRRYNKPFETFLFKGYDLNDRDIARHNDFKKIRMLCKN